MLGFLRAWFVHLRWREVVQLLRINVILGSQGPIMAQITLIGLLGFGIRIHLFFRGMETISIRIREDSQALDCSEDIGKGYWTEASALFDRASRQFVAPMTRTT